MNFDNYRSYIDQNSLEVKQEKKYKPEIIKFVIRLELVNAKIKDFSQTEIDEVIYDYKKDINDTITEKADIIYEKASAKITFLDIGNKSIVIGLEIDKHYINYETETTILKDKNCKNKKLSRFIGIYFSRHLFHVKKWNALVNGDSSLFRIKEMKIYK